ncbi:MULTISPECIES: hypothetical protein [unclassified Pseudomonas]|uniref:hypothetical protein n=1 Tax=unclassified Pseudomonas TaxID=196821 RepID=UPI0038514A13
MDWVQWPAMLAIVLASWLVGSKRAERRTTAFAIFIIGNLLWVAWGFYIEAYALALLDITLCGMNVRGFLKNRAATRMDAYGAGK